MSATSFTLKQGRIERLTLTTLDLWKRRGIGRDVIFFCQNFVCLSMVNSPGAMPHKVLN
jgi:hypothetical protein